jgi:glycosyltransferase involved in cell wall biosynthesis
VSSLVEKEPIRTPTATAAGAIWIVMAAYNEGRRLDATLTGLCRQQTNVVVVDDGSRDDTAAVALRYPVWLLRHVVNCGQGAALQTGIDFALGQGAGVIVTFDADGQHDPADIPALTEPVLTGQADAALGSRFLGRAVGLPWSRWLLLKLAVVFTRVFSGIRVSDTHNGFRALSRSAAERVRITHDRMAHASEILDQIKQHGLRFVEVPVRITYSRETLAKGQSSWNALKIAGQLFLGRFMR